jgi:hypothetical protein
MSNKLSPLDAWLSGENITSEADQQSWDPGFDAERSVVVAKLGPYHKFFQRPQNFAPRFFHQIYALSIEDWQLTVTTRLYNGFCTLTAELAIRFQPTFKYIERNYDDLIAINNHIKKTYEGFIIDMVNAEFNRLKDGLWVHTGLTEIEKQIETVINEALILKHIQCRTICQLSTHFVEFDDDQKLDGRFTQEAIYLNVMQKHFEFREKQAQELFRQEDELELLNLEHKQKQLESINQIDLLQRQKQALEADSIKRQLEEQEAQRMEQHVIEMRLQVIKTKHDLRLKEIEMEGDIQYQKEMQIRQQKLNVEKQALQIEHERVLKEFQREAEIRDYEKQQFTFMQEKEQEQRIKQIELEADLKEQEHRQLESQNVQIKLEALKIEHENRLYQMQLDLEVKEIAQRAEATNNKDEYLRREIEWLVLDKQRAELMRLIREADGDKR